VRVVVLGAGGQLGRELARVLPPDAAFLARRDLDVRDEAAVVSRLAAAGADVVVNAAADNRVDAAESDPGTAFAANATGAAHVARAAAALGSLLVHFSTDYVFDGRARRPYREDDRPNPQSAYGRSKHAGERLVAGLAPRHAVVRLAGLYAAGGSRGKGGSFIDRVLAQAEAGATLRVVADQVTAPTWARDVAETVAALVPRWLAGSAPFGLYHLTNAGACTWHEFACAALACRGRQERVEPISTATLDAPASRPAYSVLANARLASLDVPPLRHWRDALAAYLAVADSPD
jgi:dTDP-4-dehydrorhamnose reductase